MSVESWSRWNKITTQESSVVIPDGSTWIPHWVFLGSYSLSRQSYVLDWTALNLWCALRARTPHVANDLHHCHMVPNQKYYMPSPFCNLCNCFLWYTVLLLLLFPTPKLAQGTIQLHFGCASPHGPCTIFVNTLSRRGWPSGGSSADMTSSIFSQVPWKFFNPK
jgi:hypothetical protein